MQFRKGQRSDGRFSQKVDGREEREKLNDPGGGH